MNWNYTKKRYCIECNKLITNKATYCLFCVKKGNRSTTWKGGISRNKEYKRKYQQEYFKILKNKERRNRLQLKYNSEPKYKKWRLKYQRKNKLNTKNKSFKVIKKDYPKNNSCELSKKTYKRLNYHHWDDTDLVKNKFVKGIWCCTKCHRVCEAIEYDKSNKIKENYLKIKKSLEN